MGAKRNKKVENQMSSSLHEVTLAMRFTTVTQKEKEQKESEFFLFSDIILKCFYKLWRMNLSKIAILIDKVCAVFFLKITDYTDMPSVSCLSPDILWNVS